MASTAELIHLVAAGDANAWGLLAERHLETVRATATAICGDTDLAEDAIQETFLRLRAGAGTFKPRSGDGEDDGRRWIRRLAANCSIDRLRERRRDRARALGDIAGPLEADAPDEAMHAALGRAMSRLGAAARTALDLRFRDGLDGSALATALGVNRVAARVRVHRAMSALRRNLAAEGVAVTPAILLGFFACSSEAAEAVPEAAYAAAGPSLLGTATVMGGSLVVVGALTTTAILWRNEVATPAVAPVQATTSIRTAEPVWTELFPDGDFSGWLLDHGSWSHRAGVVLGEGSGEDNARLQSRQDFADLELSCRIRMGGSLAYGELQVGGYNTYFVIPAGSRRGTDGWVEVSLVQRDGQCICSADGTVLVAQKTDQGALRPGPLAFYASRGSRMEITQARVRTLPAISEAQHTF